MSPLHESVVIALVEDDPGHARLIQKNLRRAGVKNQIVVLEDGQKAMDYMEERKQVLQRNPTSPTTLMLLDLNLPVLTGYQVLEQMKQDDALRRVPVIVLTTTDDSREIEACFELGCNIYIVKPVHYEDFIDAIQRLGLLMEVAHWPSRAMKV